MRVLDVAGLILAAGFLASVFAACIALMLENLGGPEWPSKAYRDRQDELWNEAAADVRSALVRVWREDRPYDFDAFD